MIAHYSNESGLLDKKLGIGGGQIGVMLFYSISSFLMFSLYYPHPQHRKIAPEFLQNRFARILPLYFLVVLMSYYFSLYLPAYNMLGMNNDNLLQHFYFHVGNSILWTIRPEVQFYLAFFVFLLSQRWLQHFVLVFSLLLTGISYLPLHFSPLATLEKLLFPHPLYKYFIVGMLIYFVHERAGYFSMPRILDLVLSMLSLALFIVIYPQIYLVLFGYILPRNGWESCIPPLVLSLLLLGSLRLSGLRVIFSSKVLVYLGDISFSIYLLHIFILQIFVMHGYARPSLLVFAVYLVSVVAVSSLVYHFFESPCRRLLRRKWFAAKAPEPAAVTFSI